jgi:hypothetical protein
MSDKMASRKIIQIATATVSGGFWSAHWFALIALCDDGSIWVKEETSDKHKPSKGWVRQETDAFAKAE